MITPLRLYSFVAGLYLSELQKGLQTGHVISEIHANLLDDTDKRIERVIYDSWAHDHKTIVILNALNSAGVNEAANKLQYFGEHFNLPTALFCEDVASLNGAPTAAGMVIPADYFAAFKVDPRDPAEFPEYGYLQEGAAAGVTYEAGSMESKFITFLKGYRLA